MSTHLESSPLPEVATATEKQANKRPEVVRKRQRRRTKNLLSTHTAILKVVPLFVVVAYSAVAQV